MSSRRRLRRKAEHECARKRPYPTWKEADAVCQRVAAQQPEGRRMHPYQCGPHWHVGHSPRRVAQARSAAIRARREGQ